MKPADLTTIQPAITKIQAMEQDICAQLLEREDVTRAALVALIARQHIVLIGPPGTGKSMLVNLLAERIAPASGGGLRQFIWLLTRFTTPEELFGPISVVGLKKDEYRRITTNKLPEAEIAFLDEIFKANSAVLNALLTILNERAFDNGPQRLQVPLVSCFGASNEMPQGDDLAALWDRFALRSIVEYTSDGNFSKLLQLAASATRPATMTQAELEQIQQAAATLPIPSTVFDALAQLRKELSQKGITASDRRWRQTLGLIRAQAIIEGRGSVDEDDLSVLKDAMWTRPEERAEIARTVAKLSNPMVAKAIELGDQAASVHSAAMTAQKGSGTEEQKMQAAVEAASKLKNLAGQLKRILEQMQSQGRNTAKIERINGQVNEMRQQIAELVL
jgi:MoxR-like ATPase